IPFQSWMMSSKVASDKSIEYFLALFRLLVSPGRPGNRRPRPQASERCCMSDHDCFFQTEKRLLAQACGFCEEGRKTMPALFSLSAILYLPQIMNSIVSFPKLLPRALSHASFALLFYETSRKNRQTGVRLPLRVKLYRGLVDK